jgi:hypothetical protein
MTTSPAGPGLDQPAPLPESVWLAGLLDLHLAACYARAMGITGSAARSEQAVEAAFRAVARTRERLAPDADIGRILALATEVSARSNGPDRSRVSSDGPDRVAAEGVGAPSRAVGTVAGR